MSLDHCIELVTAGDPDRAMVTAQASPAAQARLWPIWALQLEIARAAWASQEPLVAEMRLQWWHDALAELAAGQPVRAHPVLEACAFLAGDAGAGQILHALIEGRRWDIWREPMASDGDLWAHLDATGAGPLWLAARALGAGPAAEGPLRDYGAAVAMANWLVAVPDLVAKELQPLPDSSDLAIASLAGMGLSRLMRARAGRGKVPRSALPALLTGWQAPALLAQALAEPARVRQGSLALSEFQRRGRLAWVALSARW